MFRPALLPALFLLSPLAAHAQDARADLPASARVDAARAQIEEQAAFLDADRDGLISREELLANVSEVFAAMDVDASGDVGVTEFLEWRYGFADMAAFRGRTQAFDATMGFLFDLFDTSDDGRLAPAEFVAGLEASMDYADRDGDGALDREEFMRGFVVNVALRHALTE